MVDTAGQRAYPPNTTGAKMVQNGMGFRASHAARMAAAAGTYVEISIFLSLPCRYGGDPFVVG